MKYVAISNNETLSSLTQKVGIQIVDQLIADNDLKRAPNIGKQWAAKVAQAKNNPVEVEPMQKVNTLNQFVTNSDIYERAVLSSSAEWKVLSQLNSFSNYLYVSDRLEDSIVDSYDVLGNRVSVPSSIYEKINDAILHNNPIDGSIFGTYSTMQNVGIVNAAATPGGSSNPLGWFKIPTTEVMLYSTLSGQGMSIPAYPEEISDTRSATYTTMTDLIYQYEPWQMYQSSGPRSNTYEFHLHRDMWSGNHLDGKANELVRFCEAQCYPQYNGSAVNAPTVSLYISGSNLITGVMTEVRTNWSGPLGQDGFYLELKLSISITEVSQTTLDYDSVMRKSLIG